MKKMPKGADQKLLSKNIRKNVRIFWHFIPWNIPCYVSKWCHHPYSPSLFTIYDFTIYDFTIYFTIPIHHLSFHHLFHPHSTIPFGVTFVGQSLQNLRQPRFRNQTHSPSLGPRRSCPKVFTQVAQGREKNASCDPRHDMSRRIWTYTFYILTIYLKFILAFYLAFSQTYSDILFGILCDMHSGVLSDILSGRLSGISFGILSGIYSGILSGINSDILSEMNSAILSGILSGILSDIYSDILSDI